jgi:hypothetical protein
MMLVHGCSTGHVGFATASTTSRTGRAGVKVLVTYGLSVFCYIVITFFTKRLLSWNLALVYFVATLEVLPRTYHRLRRELSSPAPGHGAQSPDAGVDR